MKTLLKSFARVMLLSTILAFSILFTPFIRVSYASTSMKVMMPKQGANGNCVTVCGSQNTVHFNDIQRKQVDEDKEPSPEPAEPYYHAFMGVGWATVITVAAAHLFKYLRWRPPDLYKLNVNYQF
jgi:hypothetical protein